MDANLAFPCFDQPDLKGRFTLGVTAPSDWAVVSNGIESIEPAGPGRTRTRFSETKPISTYLFAFAAGPFEQIPAKAGDLNLRLWVRKSQLARAREEWPEVSERTREGLQYLSEFFAQPFPFPKYDQVLIPGFAYGGMEHAGATFLNEDSILFRSAPTQNDHNRRSETVLHELAHQWFGDLVTMRWFDDLWLKEGFAQYMAYRTMATIQPPDDVWKRFYNSIKRAAYAIDSTHGTTPIYQQIANLKDAKSAYGAIVYSKAPSLLRFLAYRIGDDHFREGVRGFLREHAFSNATWNDLIGAFSRASNQNLLPWANAWVEQRGMPQVEMDWECGPDRRMTKFTVTQRDALGEGHLWPISTGVLLGYRSTAPELLTARIETAAAGLPEAVGRNCPDYVFANDQDFAYGEFLLDERSQKAIGEIAPVIENPFQRALLWGALWDSVRESRMAPLDFIGLAMRSLPREQDPELALSLLGRMRTAYVRYLSGSQHRAVTSEVESLLLDEMQSAPSTDLRINYFRSLVDLAESERARQALKDLLAGNSSVPGVTLKQRDRWSIIARLVAAGDPAADDLLASERVKDQTEEGRKYAYVAAAASARAETKKKYFSDYTSSSEVSEDWITASLPAFNIWSQPELTLPYLKPALEALPEMKRTRKIFFVLNWLENFVGGQSSAEALEVLNRFLAGRPIDPDLKLKVLEVKDELERAVRIQAKYAQGK
jgi:aminopeptidase N